MPQPGPAFRSISPKFTVPDVVGTPEYYRDTLGFRIAGYWADPPCFAIVERDGVELFFSQATPDTAPRAGRVPGGYDAYIHFHGLTELARVFAECGAVLLEGPTPHGYGQLELVVQDCNGLVIAFGEEIAAGASAVCPGPPAAP